MFQDVDAQGQVSLVVQLFLQLFLLVCSATWQNRLQTELTLILQTIPNIIPITYVYTCM